MGMIYAPPSIIPNGALINNVCHIYQSTRPTTRPDGSALAIGDIWFDSAKGNKGFWNGLHFCSTEATYVLGLNYFYGNPDLSQLNCPENYLVESLILKGKLASAPNWGNTNFWRFLIRLQPNYTIEIQLKNNSGYVFLDPHHILDLTIPINAVSFRPPGGHNGVFMQIRQQGSPTTSQGLADQVNPVLKIREIYL